MLSPIAFSSQIPFAALLTLGTEAQAAFVQGSGPVGTTLLALEHCYGGVPFSDHGEANMRLGEVGLSFKRYMTESSVAFLSTIVLTEFLQKNRIFPQEGTELPALLTDLLMGRHRHPRVAPQATSLIGAAAHLGSLVGAPFEIVRGNGEEIGLYDAANRAVIGFPSGRAEMQVGTPVEKSDPLLALVALHLRSLAEASPERETAARLARAALQVYPV